MSPTMSEVAESPKITGRVNAEDATLNRWSKHGEDRLYVNDSKVSYVDLKAGEIAGSNGARIVEYDDETGRLVISWWTGWDSSKTDHELVISLTGDNLDTDTTTDSSDTDSEPADVPPTLGVADPGIRQQGRCQTIARETVEERPCERCGATVSDNAFVRAFIGERELCRRCEVIEGLRANGHLTNVDEPTDEQIKNAYREVVA